VDPRRTETARYADIHLQPYPGEDPAIAAGLLNVMLARGLYDAEFCARHVDGLDALRQALNAGAVVYVPDDDGQLILTSLRGKRFRLSYLLAPLYGFPIRLGKEVALSRILRSVIEASERPASGQLEFSDEEHDE